MKVYRIRDFAIAFAAVIVLFATGCGEMQNAQTERAEQPPMIVEAPPPSTPAPTPAMPDLQAEITDDRYKQGNSPLALYDFKNHLYPLPRGWQNPDSSESRLVNGVLAPVSDAITENMPDNEKVKAKSERRIGLSHVVTRYFDATGDGLDEAVVILKIETTGNAIPQIVYVYGWKDDKPELLWHFRTGDRADGGLKDIRTEGGQLVVELFGQDRYLLGEIETGKITGDEEQLCCPTHFTRTVYKWNGKNFLRQGDRLTLPTSEPNATPVKNMGDIVNAQEKRGR